ncbi:hypothetical protein, partial [Thiohalobacter thiocyanaticus]|uniref:hypothetical protein n=1 Tax=Thiohalobacter thiocyanaticus TaxID=585455 RepID=UPI0019D435E9
GTYSLLEFPAQRWEWMHRRSHVSKLRYLIPKESRFQLSVNQNLLGPSTSPLHNHGHLPATQSVLQITFQRLQKITSEGSRAEADQSHPWSGRFLTRGISP